MKLILLNDRGHVFTVTVDPKRKGQADLTPAILMDEVQAAMEMGQDLSVTHPAHVLIPYGLLTTSVITIEE